MLSPEGEFEDFNLAVKPEYLEVILKLTEQAAKRNKDPRIRGFYLCMLRDLQSQLT